MPRVAIARRSSHAPYETATTTTARNARASITTVPMTRPPSSRPTPTAARRSRPAFGVGGGSGASSTVPWSGASGRPSVGSAVSAGASVIVVQRSDVEELGLLVLEQVVDQVDVPLGDRLELLLGARALVLADVAVLDELLEGGLGVAADVAHRDLGVLGLGVRHLDVLAATLLGQHRHHATDERAVVARVDAEVGLLDRLLDGVHRGLVAGADDDGARLGVLEGGELLQRGRRTVVVDEDLLEHARVGAPGADAREALLGDLDGLLHLLLGVEQGLVDHRGGSPSHLPRGERGGRVQCVKRRRWACALGKGPSRGGGDQRADLLAEQRAGDVAVTLHAED